MIDQNRIREITINVKTMSIGSSPPTSEPSTREKVTESTKTSLPSSITVRFFWLGSPC